MSRRKKKRSITLDRSQAREAGILSIAPELDFGNGLTTATFSQLIAQTRQALNDYNLLLSKIDQAYNDFKDLERSLADMADRVLTGVAAQYGKNSNEYEMAGGTRKSERRRSRSRPPEPVSVDS
ncbi:MAG: hypothetical protein AAFR99_17870 [Cyanobacteria bacterium J06629_9]